MSTDDANGGQHAAHFQSSLERVTSHPEFLDRFYDTFMSATPEAAEKFAGIDMGRLKRHLKSSLNMLTLAADGVPGTTMYLEYLGERHRKLDVGNHLYGQWLDALIETARCCDEGFSSTDEDVWRAVLLNAMGVMQSAASEYAVEPY
ncbi:MAG: globin [Gammaproteobacteria bacterium]